MNSLLIWAIAYGVRESNKDNQDLRDMANGAMVFAIVGPLLRG